MTSYVDTHCHLDELPHPGPSLDRAEDTVVVAVTNLPSRYRIAAARYRGDRRIRVALGLHPLYADTAGPLEEGLLIRLLNAVEYVSEVGLDFSQHGRETKASQLRVFDKLLAQPTIAQRFVSVHSRGAEKVVIERLAAAGVVAVLHWYTGPPRLIDHALAAGLYFSINPSMVLTEKGRQTIAAVPRERILTESDGPFAKYRGRSTEPADMPSVIKALALAWETTPLEAKRVVHKNVADLYRATVGARLDS
jgi:TatD DNase family protein